MLHTKFCENLPVGSGEEDFFFFFHSYRDESIGRWGENRSTRGKTT